MKICYSDGCSTRPTFGFKSDGIKLSCTDHKQPGHEYLVRRRKRRVVDGDGVYAAPGYHVSVTCVFGFSWCKNAVLVRFLLKL